MYKVDSEVRVVATPPMKNIYRGFVFYGNLKMTRIITSRNQVEPQPVITTMKHFK